MGQVEQIVLRHGARGMDILKDYLPADVITRVADNFASGRIPKGTVLLTTGFYVAGYAETDGPAGTYFLAQALSAMGYHSVIITDDFCRGFFEGVETEYVNAGFNAMELLYKYAPVALISIERCGRNVNGDYANMRGVSIAEHTPPIDDLFTLASQRGVHTIGIGDGGNEIGMGKLAEVILKELSLVPCAVPTDELIAATVSNWGAYGLCAELQRMTGLPLLPSYERVYDYIAKTVEIGSVDGVNKTRTPTEDGFDTSVTKEILDALALLPAY